MSSGPGVVVIGHGPAGAAAANAFREQDAHTPITIISGEELSCYSRPRLPEVVSGKVAPEAIRLHPDEWYAGRGMKLSLCQNAVKLDTAGHRLELPNGEIIFYTKLVIATGALPVQPPIACLWNGCMCCVPCRMP